MSDPYSPWAPANLKVLIPFVYAVPLLLFYTLTIVVVLAKLKGAFHRLFAVTGITDIFSWILTFVLRRAKAAPLFFVVYESPPSEGSFVTFVVFAYYYALYAQLFATFFLISSRFTAALFPLKHRTIWTRFIWVAYVITALLPLALTWNIWLCDCGIEKENPAKPWEGYRWVMTKEKCWSRRTIITAVAEIIHLLLVLSMSVAIFVRMYRLRRQIEAFTEAKDDR